MLVRDELVGKVRVVRNELDEVIWLELLVGKEMIIVSFVYFFPEDSPFSREDIIEE